MTRIIFHIDLDAFYASCAMVAEPYLRDKIFAVGHKRIGNEGVLLTSSYKARALGIHAGMPLWQALARYPELIIVPVEFPLYSKFSKIFLKHLTNYSDLILQASIDEAYVDVTELSKTIHPLTIAKNIQEALLREHGLGCSIGIAPTLYLAKVASDLDKPMGISVLRKRDIAKKLFPMPIEDLHGIGKKTAPRLQLYGINTVGDFVNQENQANILRILSNRNYQIYLKRIFGQSTNVVKPDLYAIPQSISNETTFNYGRDHYDMVFPFLEDLTRTVISRMKSEKVKSNTFGIKLKYEDFEMISRRKKIKDYTDDYNQIINVIDELFEKYHSGGPLRLVGIFADPVIPIDEIQADYNLFTYQEILLQSETEDLDEK